jgi:hypothetical protein
MRHQAAITGSLFADRAHICMRAVTGTAALLRSNLGATAAVVFAGALPGGVGLGLDESSSYAGGCPDAALDDRRSPARH